MRSTVCSLLAIDLCTLCALCALSALSAVSLSAGDTDIRSLLEGGHWKQARALLEPRVKANPSDAEAAAQLASVREAYGDSDGALQLAERAVKLKPDVAEYHWQLAWVVGNQAQHANVLHQFGLARRFRQEAETTIALDPKHIDARLGMITYYIKAPGILGGDRQKADEMAEEVARIDAASGYLARARVLSDSDTAGDFETLYRQAAEAARTPDVKYDATAALSNWYFAQKPPRYDAAEQQCRWTRSSPSPRRACRTIWRRTIGPPRSSCCRATTTRAPSATSESTSRRSRSPTPPRRRMRTGGSGRRSRRKASAPTRSRSSSSARN